MVELAEVDTAQMATRQMQLEETLGAMSQEIGTIKQLLNRQVVPRAPTTTRGENAIEEQRVVQQTSKTNTYDNATPGRRTNSQ